MFLPVLNKTIKINTKINCRKKYPLTTSYIGKLLQFIQATSDKSEHLRERNFLCYLNLTVVLTE